MPPDTVIWSDNNEVWYDLTLGWLVLVLNSPILASERRILVCRFYFGVVAPVGSVSQRIIALGKSDHRVVYAGDSMFLFISQAGLIPWPANHTRPTLP